ncbi:expressed protein [Phakopsora pachyrhizi]|uniref:Expressed protein n=1 Tax=Phakopsora pachyrhizi TaxID=170000 RepID=A0AAV0ANW4_PHAPC|nr:expressed protein [Phakopsora pachyrhizi]
MILNFPMGSIQKLLKDHELEQSSFNLGVFWAQPGTQGTRSSSVSSSCELELSHEASDKKFLDAITRSISRGCFNVDLDGQGICSIPDFAEVMERERFNDTSKNQLLSSKLFKPIQSSLSRQSISRVRSAPSVSFAPSQSVTLYLSNNYISSASNLERLCNFKGLQVLTLRANQLTELPESIGDLISLTQLNISYNQLRFLPSSVLRLKSCKFFTAGNPWIKSSDEGFKPINGNTNSAGSNKRDEDVPSLAEICLRKICRINGNDDRDRYKIDRACETREDVDYESIIDSERFPDSIKSVLRFPEQHFKRCVCGEYRLNLKYEGIKFRCLNPFEAQPLVPIRFRAAHSGCLRALLS